jgi:hypothetical protein
MLTKLYLVLYCIVWVFLSSCARPTDREINVSSDNFSSTQSKLYLNNYVTNKIGSITLSNIKSIQLPYVSYVPPIVLLDKNTGKKYVFVLVATNSKLKLIRYVVENALLIIDTNFKTVEFSAKFEYFKVHQMALALDSKGGIEVPYIFVAHKYGLSKVNAISGHVSTSEFFENSQEAGLRLGVEDDFIYFQTEGNLFEFKIDFTDRRRAQVEGGPNQSEIYLPIVIQNERPNYLYVERSGTIYCFMRKHIYSGSLQPCIQTKNAIDIDGDVGAFFISSYRYNKPVLLYSVVKPRPTVGSTITEFFYFSNNYNARDDFSEFYYKIARSTDIFQFGDMMGTAVVSYGKHLILPGVSRKGFTKQGIDSDGIMYSSDQESYRLAKKTNEPLEIQNKLNKKVVRFMLYDNGSDKLLSVFNYNVKGDFKNFNYVPATEICLNSIFFNNIPKDMAIDDACELLEDDTDSILSIGVGKDLLLFTSSNKKLYYIY